MTNYGLLEDLGHSENITGCFILPHSYGVSRPANSTFYTRPGVVAKEFGDYSIRCRECDWMIVTNRFSEVQSLSDVHWEACHQNLGPSSLTRIGQEMYA